MIRAKYSGESVLVMENLRGLEKYKKDIVSECKACSGTGIIYKNVDANWKMGATEWERCECFKTFMMYFGMCRGNMKKRSIDKVMEEKIYPRKCKIMLENKKTDVLRIFNKYTQNLEEIMESGIGLFISGKNGCGKTTLAHMILLKAVQKEYYVYYITLSNLLELIIRSYKDNELHTKVEEVSGVDFLVIDELGKEPKQSRHSFEQVETLLRERANESLPTILLTNMMMREFKNTYGDSIWSVINRDMLMVRIYDKRDFRQTSTKTISEKLEV